MRRGRPELLVLAIDIGTSSVRAALFDAAARRIPNTLAAARYALQYTAEGGAELSSAALLRATRACIRRTLLAKGHSRLLSNQPVAAIGISGFWHSLLGLDRKSEPTTRVFTWADSRAASDAEQLRRDFNERAIHRETGCMLRAPYWPAKLRWLARTERALFVRTTRWVSAVDWIVENVFGGATTSVSMASGTGLWRIDRSEWHRELLAACGIDDSKLLPIEDAGASVERGPRALKNARIFAAIGDGAASNLGSGAHLRGTAAINIGTSAAVRVVQSSGARSKSTPFGLFRYALDKDRTVLGGAVSNAGNLHVWCLRELRLRADAPSLEVALDRSRATTNPLRVLPFWTMERAPTWPDHIGGVIAGLRQGTTAADALCAISTSVYYRLADILAEIEATAGRADTILVSGGVLNSPESLRLLADAIGRDLDICDDVEASLRGAARYCLERLGVRAKAFGSARRVPCDRKLAEAHRLRRADQQALERLLSRLRVLGPIERA